MEGAHDLGGLGGFGPVLTADGELTHHESWELRAQGAALFGVRGGMRRWIEQLDPLTYLSSPYYVRWLRAAELGAVAQGVVTVDDLARWRDAFAADPDAVPPTMRDADGRAFVDRVMTSVDRLPRAADPQFRVGDGVVVKRWYDAEHHHRCPRYVRGVRGVVETVCGDEVVPGGDGERAPTYTVAFTSTDLWGAGGEPEFSVHVDLCEQYLEAAP